MRTLACLGLTDIGEALEGLVQQGVRNRETLLSLAPATALIAKSTGLDVNEVAKQMFILTDRFKIGRKEAVGMFARMKRLVKENAVSMEDLNETFEQFSDSIEIAFAGTEFGADATKRALSGVQTLRAAAGEQWGQIADFTQKISESLQDPYGESMLAMTQLTGKSFEQIQAIMAEGRPDKLFGDAVAGINRQAKDARGFAILAEQVGISSSALVRMSKAGPDIIKNFQRLNEESASATDNMDSLREGVVNTTTVTERFSNKLSALTGKELPLLGVSLAEIGQEAKDIDFVQVVAGATILSRLKTVITGILGKFPAGAALLTAISAKFATATAAMGSAVALLLNPWVLAGIAITAIIVGLLKWTGKLDDAWKAVKDGFQPLVDDIVTGWNDIKKAFSDIFSGGADGAFKARMTAVMDVVVKVVGVISKVLGFLGRLIVLGIVNNLKILAKWWQLIWEEIVLPVFAILSDAMAEVRTELEPFFKFLGDAFGGVSGDGGGLIDTFKSISAAVFKFLVPVMRFIAKFVGFFVKVFVGQIVNKIKFVIRTFMAFFNFWKKILMTMIGLFTGELSFADALGEVFDAVIDLIKDRVTAVLKFVQDQITLVLDALGLEGASESVKGIFAVILGAVSAPLEVIKGFINSNIIPFLNDVIAWDPPGPGGTIGKMFGLEKLTPLAEGGLVMSPTVALVGERGPELVIPLKDSSLSNIQDLATEIADAMATTINVQPTINVNVDQDKVATRLDRLIAIVGRSAQRTPRTPISPEVRRLAGLRREQP